MKGRNIVKSFLLVLFCLTGITAAASSAKAAGVTINSANFPDDAFRSYISADIDTNGDNKLSSEEIASTSTISVDGKGIRSLKGIEYFTALKYLRCSDNQLTALDVSKNTALLSLYCSGNQLTALDVSKNTALLYLYCPGNKLAALDVSQNTALKFLYCSENKLTRLDVSKNRELKELACEANSIPSLDICACPTLVDTYRTGTRTMRMYECYQIYIYDKNSSSFLFVDTATTVIVPAELIITGQPVKVTAAVGETAKYTVSASGTGLTYQWQYRNPNGTNVWKNSGAPGNKTNTLSITVTAASNKMQYRCKVTDAAGQKKNSNYASLIVKTAITKQPVKVTAAVGATAKYTVTATGAGLKYRWQYRNPNGANTWKNSEAAGSRTNTLSITVKASSNKMQYRCVITDANGTKTNSHYASLLVKTTITAEPKSVTVSAGHKTASPQLSAATALHYFILLRRTTL